MGASTGNYAILDLIENNKFLQETVIFLQETNFLQETIIRNKLNYKIILINKLNYLII